MRIAILIGVSKFDNCNNLPGCENDVTAIHEILKATNQFDDVKFYKGKVDSKPFKTELAEYFSELKGENIEEVFFYFSGHGNFYKNEFYYVLSDFDESQRKQTSLQNSEIDKLIKSIKPKLVSKIIDACQSGVSYVKGENRVEKYYNRTTDNFEKCYFMHSSQTSQFSYQDNDLSDFTKSFLSSLRSNDFSNIRYKHIIDYISDEFERSTEQTPFFVTQADYTEIFIQSSKEINQLIERYIPSLKVKDQEKKNEESPAQRELSYIDKIKLEAKEFSNEEDTKKLIDSIKDCIKRVTLKTDLKELYDITFLFEHNTLHIPKGSLIGTWLKENSHQYFAKPYYKTITYREEIVPNSISPIMNMMNPHKIVTKEKQELDGFQTTFELPHSYVVIKYVPKYPNIKQFAVFLTYLVSKKDIKLFYGFTDYKEKNWLNKSVNLNFKWSSTDFKLIDEKLILDFIKNLLMGIEENIKARLNNKLDPEK